MDTLKEEAAPEATPKKSSRLELRNAILNAKADSEFVDAFGVRIEIRYPTLEDLLQYRNASDDDRLMARAIINNCYDPESGERIFEDADADVLMTQKFTPDMRKLNAAINKILAGDDDVIKSVEDNTKSNPE
jgi:hypothetical protein